MHTESLKHWQHDHVFGQDRQQAGEFRTRLVIVITAITMVLEIGAGLAFGSMALLADGLHMGSHASALAVSAFAYWYTRRHARDPRFSFGTGKVNSLAAFASAVMLGMFAVVMVVESVERLIQPVEIVFDQAILVAVVGLVVNGICLLILGGHGHSHTEENHTHDHSLDDSDHEHHHEHEHRHDHNLLSAYLHVMADALTSVLAIGALLAGKYASLNWLDPVIGILGALLIVRWSIGLLKTSSSPLLDMQAPPELLETVRRAIEEQSDNRVSDLHVWSVGDGKYAAQLAVVTSMPGKPQDYIKLIPARVPLVHVAVEVNQCNTPST